MSTCISKHGEFSAHTLGEGENEFTCTLCWVEDTDAMRAALAEVTASLRYSENARDIMRREKEHGWAEADRMEAERDAALAELAALRAAGGQEKPQPVSDPYKLLDEVERIVKFEAGPNDVYMRADVLSVIRQVRAAAPVGGQAEPSDDFKRGRLHQAEGMLAEFEQIAPALPGSWMGNLVRSLRANLNLPPAAAAAVPGEQQDTTGEEVPL